MVMSGTPKPDEELTRGELIFAKLLGPGQYRAMSTEQRGCFNRGVFKMANEQRDEDITDDMIQDYYELVVRHLAPGPLQAALNVALTQTQLDDLTPRQAAMFRDGIARMLDEYGEDHITPAMIQGRYELITEHLWTREFEESLAEAKRIRPDLFS